MSIIGAIAVPHPPLILPEVGRGEEQGIKATIEAFRQAAAYVAELKPETVVISSPHSVMYGDYFHISPGERAEGDFSQFRAPQAKVKAEYDAPFVQRLAELAAEDCLPAGTLGERSAALDHGTMIPLRFLQEAGFAGRVVRVGLAGLGRAQHYRLGQLIARTAAELGRRVAFVASGDLSHKLKADGPYGFAAEGPVFDARMEECFRDGDFLKLMETPAELADGAAECGLRSFWIMAGALDRTRVEPQLLSYEGPFGVGYGVAIFRPAGRDEGRDILAQLTERRKEELASIRAQEDICVQLARLSLEHFLEHHRYLELPGDLPASWREKWQGGLPRELLEERSGAFVSLKKEGQLRGCIGTILAVRRSLAEEIVYNAVSAGTQDPRFEQVTPEELWELVYDVDVLSEPEPIDSEKQLDVKKYGVIVQCGNRRGLLLPDLAGVDTVEEQLAIARKKGGIGAKEKVQLYRFTVERHL